MIIKLIGGPFDRQRYVVSTGKLRIFFVIPTEYEFESGRYPRQTGLDDMKRFEYELFDRERRLYRFVEEV